MLQSCHAIQSESAFYDVQWHYDVVAIYHTMVPYAHLVGHKNWKALMRLQAQLEFDADKGRELTFIWFRSV